MLRMTCTDTSSRIGVFDRHPPVVETAEMGLLLPFGGSPGSTIEWRAGHSVIYGIGCQLIEPIPGLLPHYDRPDYVPIDRANAQAT
jgi:hypothetical protein